MTDSALTVVLIGTLDTKGPETAYLRDRIREAGLRTCVIDTGILGEPLGLEPDISDRMSPARQARIWKPSAMPVPAALPLRT